MLGRDTEWRQGNLLTDEAAHALELVKVTGSSSRVVVISHDCDLPNDIEEFVEVIIGSLVEAPNPMLANARNPRRLQIKFASQSGEELHVELHHANRREVSKAEFAKFAAGNPDFTLLTDEKRALKQWLAARYGRPAFPRVQTQLKPICHHGCDSEGSFIVSGEFVIAGCDAPKVLQAAEHGFNHPSEPVSDLVEANPALAGCPARNDRLRAFVADRRSQPVAVIAFVGHDMTAVPHLGQEGFGDGDVGDVARRHLQDHRPAERVAQSMDLRGLSAAGNAGPP